MVSNINKVLAVLVLLSSSMIVAPSASADEPQTWYVASSGSDDSAGTNEAPFRNVQTAIRAAEAGDTISVSDGLYNGFAVNKSLTILGPNDTNAPGPDATREPEAVVAGAVTIDSGSDGVTLSGFSFITSDTSQSVGLVVRSNTKNVSITYNDISGFQQGIQSQGNSLNFGTDMNVSYNYVHDLGLDASYGSYAMHLRNVKAVTVSHNVIMDNLTGLSGQQQRRGILLRGTQNSAVRNNVVNFGSSASTKSYYAISVVQMLNDAGNGNDLQISNVEIKGNTVSGSSLGINLSALDSQASGIVVRENTVRNVFTGIHFRSFGQTGATVVNELLVQQNDLSVIENSGTLSAGIQVFSFDFTPPYSFNEPASNEFDGVVINGNWLPTGKINQPGQINGLSVGAVKYPGLNLFPGDTVTTLHNTVINKLDARGNYWGSAAGAGTAGGSSVTTGPYIATYTNNRATAGRPGFWPELIKRSTATVSGTTAQTITFSPATSLTAVTNTYALVATASSGLTVGFSSTTPEICTVSGTTLTPVQIGICSIRASQAGDSTYSATSIQKAIVITRATQAITSFNPTAMTMLSGPQTLSAIGGLGSAEVTFTENSAACEIIDGNSLIVVGAGTCLITASQAADNQYAATSIGRSIWINRVAQTITGFNPTNMTIASAPQTLSAIGGLGSEGVTFTTSSAACSVSGNSVTAVRAGYCVITASQSTDGIYAAAKSVSKTIMIRR